jgi:prophage regulatory protein
MQLNSSELTVLRMPAVLNRIGVSRSVLYKLINAGKFPQSRVVGLRAVGWLACDVDNWLAARFGVDQQGDITPKMREAKRGQLSQGE